MKAIKIIIAIVVVMLALMVGAITFGCQDDWCYIFPWQKTPTERIQYPPEEHSEPYQATFEGEYLCLPHKNSNDPHTLECALGIKTNEGYYYALSMGDLLDTDAPTKTSMGTKISVTGLVVPIAAISSDQWQKYDIQGIMQVKTFTEK
jgi:hypothetical protein